MKKFTVLLTSVYIVSASAASAVIPAAVIAGLTIVASLTPIIKDIADGFKKNKTEEASVIIDGIASSLIKDLPRDVDLLKAINGLERIINGQSCPKFCKILGGRICRHKLFLSACKSVCQKKEWELNGYKLRIRFGKDWSLSACLDQGLEAKKQTAEGKGNPKSIAVYSEAQLKHLLSLIALQTKSHLIVSTGAENFNLKELKKEISNIKSKKEIKELSPEEMKKIVTDSAASLEKRIEESIKTEVLTGFYGPQ